QVIGQPDRSIGSDGDAVRTTNEAFAPRPLERAVLVEHDDRMRAAIEHPHIVVVVHGDGRRLDEAPSFGQRAPALDRLVTHAGLLSCVARARNEALYCHTPVTTTIGARVLRKEDRRLVTGRGRYVDDIRVDGLLHAAIVRSPHAHARIGAIDCRGTLRVPGVVAALVARDLPECAAGGPPPVASPAMRADRHPALAHAVVRHVGEAVAVVVADDPYHAADGAEAARITWEPRPAAGSVELATAPAAPRVFDDWPDNIAGIATAAVGDVTRGFAES